MNFFYESLPIHNLGECSISQGREYEGGDAVQRCKVTLRLQVEVFEASYGDNYSLMKNLLDALKKQNGAFKWEDSETGAVYLNQTVSVASHDFPEEPNAWGTYHQQANIVLYYYEQNLQPQNIPLTLTPVGGGTAVNLLNVMKWSETTSIERFSPLRDQRRMAQGRLSVSGTILADATQALATRRTDLQAKKLALEALIGKTAGVKYGPVPGTPTLIFLKAVRVDEVTAEVDEMVYAISWSFTAHWTKFPNEDSYAMAEWQVEERDQNTGEQFLVFSGKITATEEEKARNKLEAIQALVLVNFGYEESQQLRNDTTPSSVDADADGQTFIELSFAQEYRRWRPDNQVANFKKTGATGNAVNLGNVRSWVQSYEARRFNELRSQRQDAGGRVEASGTWLGDPSADLGTRRSALITLAQAMVAAVNGADGTLTYGTAFGKVVRVARFVAEVNQAITGIDWTMVAQWSEFPNEGGYATVEFTVTQRASVEDGEEFMTLAGRIAAPDESLARAKLSAVRTATLTTYGYAIEQRIREESSANGIYANGDKTQGFETHEAVDGTTFTELTFSDEYRRRKASLLSWSLRTSTRTERTTGLVMTTYSGHVIGSGTTPDAAYAAAVAKAQALGGDKESTIGPSAFLKSSSISWDKRQTQASNIEEFVRLEFSYEYQSKEGLKYYLEAASDVSVDTFGLDTETVSGFVVGPDEVTMRWAYATLVRNGYTGMLVRGERTSLSRLQTGAALNLPTGSVTELLRLDFSLQVHRLKNSGTVAYRYGISTSRDFLKLEIRTRLHGNISTSTAAAARIALNALLTAIGPTYGQQIRGEESEERAYAINAGDATGQNVFERLDFDEEFVDRLSGVSGLLEMELTEEIQYSGTRWALQPTVKNDDGSGGFTVPQDVSVMEGSRTIRGSVTAATLATAETWAKKQRAMLTGDANSQSFVLPERWERGYEFVPRVEGIAPLPDGDSSENVRVFRVGFTFAEVLPNYPSPA